MDLVNPLTAFRWDEPLDILGVPMRGIAYKQSFEFSRHGWLAARTGLTNDADAFGAEYRRRLQPESGATLRQARADYAERRVGFGPPYWLVETVGGICARRCPFCSIDVMQRLTPAGEPAAAGMLPWDVWLRFAEQCGQYGPYGLSTYQLGEPMNYRVRDASGEWRDIGDLIITAKTIGRFKKVNVSTHGDVPNLARLHDVPVDDVIISLDAITPETYARNRPVTSGPQAGAYERTVGRVRAFLADKRPWPDGPFVVVQIINSSLTRDEVLPFVREWIQVPGVDHVSVKLLDSMRAWIGERMVDDEEDAIKASAAGQMPCQHLWAVGSLTHTGVLNGCGHDAFTQLTDGSSIQSTTIADWWRGPFLDDLRAEHLAGAQRMPCRECRDRDCWLG